mmetsp:Transcript_31040/g.71018  ORF Transcript_31040/g.71018 Transcript_31040/m.71018 type:complete len:283 (-) Transcript_31040:5702-6550(-)
MSIFEDTNKLLTTVNLSLIQQSKIKRLVALVSGQGRGQGRGWGRGQGRNQCGRGTGRGQGRDSTNSHHSYRNSSSSSQNQRENSTIGDNTGYPPPKTCGHMTYDGRSAVISWRQAHARADAYFTNHNETQKETDPAENNPVPPPPPPNTMDQFAPASHQRPDSNLNDQGRDAGHGWPTITCLLAYLFFHCTLPIKLDRLNIHMVLMAQMLLIYIKSSTSLHFNNFMYLTVIFSIVIEKTKKGNKKYKLLYSTLYDTLLSLSCFSSTSCWHKYVTMLTIIAKQ